MFSKNFLGGEKIILPDGRAQKDDSAILIIGLGGTGMDMVGNTKQEVFRQIQSDQLYKTDLQYSNIQYLILDADKPRVKRFQVDVAGITDSEYFSVGFDMPYENIMKGFASKEMFTEVPEFSWFDPTNVLIHDAYDTWWVTRDVRRLALMGKVKELYEKVKNTILKAVKSSNGHLKVYICFSCGGVTGSATYLDVCYLIREAIKELEISSSQIIGFAVLPDVTCTIPSVSCDPNAVGYIKTKGCATLKELDYCMSFSENQDSFRMDYGFMKVDSKEQPFDTCFLVSARDAFGNVRANAYNNCIDAISEFVIESFIKMQQPFAMYAPTNWSGEILDDCKNVPQLPMQNGAKKGFASFGISTLELPVEDIFAYFANTIFNTHKKFSGKQPVENELDDILKQIQLDASGITKTLARNTHINKDLPEHLNYKEYKQNGDKAFLEYMEDCLKKKNDILMATIQELCSDEENAYISKLSKIMGEYYIKNIEYGPIYAHYLLVGPNNINMLHKIDGCIAMCKEIQASKLRQSGLRENSYDYANERLKKAIVLNKKSRFNDFAFNMREMYENKWDVIFYSEMVHLYEKIKQQIIQLDRDMVMPMVQAIDRMTDSFNHLNAICSERYNKSTLCKHKMFELRDIVNSVDELIKQIDIAYIYDDIVERLMQGITDGVNKQELDYSVIKYIQDELKNVCSWPMDVYLENKHQGTNVSIPSVIEDTYIKCILKPFSVDMICFAPQYHELTSETIYISVPDCSPDVFGAVINYANYNGNIKVKETNAWDKIKMITIRQNIPLYIVDGIRDWEKVYKYEYRWEKHIYTSKKENWNQKLPSVIPVSCKDISEMDEWDKSKKAFDEYNKAKELGIIDDSGQTFLVVHDPVEKSDTRFYFPSMMRNNQNCSFILRDYYVKSPIIQEEVGKIVRKMLGNA